MTAPEERAYPHGEDGGRFTFGLVVDVAEVLEQHGYPRAATGQDLVRLQQALYGFLYGGERS